MTIKVVPPGTGEWNDMRIAKLKFNPKVWSKEIMGQFYYSTILDEFGPKSVLGLDVEACT